MKAQILKSMVVNGRKLAQGEIIEVDGWRNAKALNRNRYILLIEDESPKPAVQPEKQESAEEVKPPVKKATKPLAQKKTDK